MLMNLNKAKTTTIEDNAPTNELEVTDTDRLPDPDDRRPRHVARQPA